MSIKLYYVFIPICNEFNALPNKVLLALYFLFLVVIDKAYSNHF
uniref:Uncharacterized protein n=1 Tax=Staphylococcus arlettae TaxID=29378 RepID=A0A1W5QCC1_9STAP|nr:hypothetical protein [Staphylococcus arlettae]